MSRTKDLVPSHHMSGATMATRLKIAMSSIIFHGDGQRTSCYIGEVLLRLVFLHYNPGRAVHAHV